MYFSVNLDQFQAVLGVLQFNGEFVQQLKGLKMKRIVASLITGVLAVSAFAATPTTAPVGKAVETHKASLFMGSYAVHAQAVPCHLKA